MCWKAILSIRLVAVGVCSGKVTSFIVLHTSVTCVSTSTGMLLRWITTKSCWHILNHVPYSVTYGMTSLWAEILPGWAGLNTASFLRLLIQAGFNLNVQDNDGWTPLHAAAHWGVKEACSILAEALCDMDIRNKLVSEHRCWHSVQCVLYQDAYHLFAIIAYQLDPTTWQSCTVSNCPARVLKHQKIKTLDWRKEEMISSSTRKD